VTPREWLRLAALVAVLGATLLWLSGACHERIEPRSLERAAGSASATATVEEVLEPVVEAASGTLVSARHTTVSSKILARIEELRVRAGSEVQQGDVLIVLDARDLDARRHEAREALSVAEAEHQLAQTERARVEKLVAQGVASRQELDRAISADRVTRAEVERATQRVADMEVGVSHAEIRAPVSGRVVDRLAEPGDIATPGTPLVRIYDPGALRLEAAVRESLAHHLRVGQTLQVHVEALHLTIEGVLEEIVPYAEPGARSFTAKVRLPVNQELFAGMFGRVEIPAGEEPRLRVPASAVERIGQLEFVDAIGPDGGVERRLVTTGSVDAAGRVEVLSGLAPGERVALRLADD